MAYSKNLFQALNSTWQAIGSDVMGAVACSGEDIDNESAVESCFDADHVVVYGGPNGAAAQLEFRERIKEIGYRPALLEVVKQLRFSLV